MKNMLLCFSFLVVIFPVILGSAVRAADPSPSQSSDVNETIADKAAEQNAAEAIPQVQSHIRSVFKPKRNEAGATPDQLKMIQNNCVWGLPKHLPGVEVGPTHMVYHRGYVLEESLDSKTPLWVCEHCTKAALAGHLKRTNPFQPEPQLQGLPRSELSDYRGSGFDRGHMAPNGDQTVDDHLRTDTFYLANVVPQAGKLFNQTVWADLESKARGWTKDRSETWIITGGMFYDAKEDDEHTATGLVDVARIGDDQVAVPTHLFKIVVGQDPDSHQWQAIAFVMSNEDYPNRNIDFGTYIKPVHWIEERTGVDFFPEVVAKTHDPAVKTTVEDVTPQLWEK
jgi:endonuclease G, mitochondrial